jgi:hypothetical protein
LKRVVGKGGPCCGKDKPFFLNSNVLINTPLLKYRRRGEWMILQTNWQTCTCRLRRILDVIGWWAYWAAVFVMA